MDVLVVYHVDAIVLGVTAGVRALTSHLAAVRSVGGVFGGAGWQIIADSRQRSFADVATLSARNLLEQLHLWFRWDHGAPRSRARLRHLGLVLCLINSGLLLWLARLVLSNIDQSTFDDFFYANLLAALRSCFLGTFMGFNYELLRTLDQIVVFIS